MRHVLVVIAAALVVVGCGGSRKLVDSDAITDGGSDTPDDTTADPGEDTDIEPADDPVEEHPTVCLAFDDPCDPSLPTEVGFRCIPLPGGGGYCAIACDTAAEPDPCPGPAVCYGAFGETDGWCRRDECSGFFGTDCGPPDDCIPLSGAVDVCMRSGGGAPGDPCDYHEACEPGALCLRAGTCASPDCAPLSGTVTCPPPATCRGLAMADGTLVDLGFCRDACTPWVTPASCDPGEWCLPNFYVAGTGGCTTETGSAGLYEPCDTSYPTAGCEAGMICIDPGRCQLLCDWSASPGDPGECPDPMDLCRPLADASGTVLAVGICQPTCGFHEDIPCSDAALTCLMGEMFGYGFDACSELTTILDPGDDCTAAGLGEYHVCGPNSFCVELVPGDGVRCWDACATSEGGFGTTGHPDCRNATLTCRDLFGEPEFGLCH